jgi:hypothetical protein
MVQTQLFLPINVGIDNLDPFEEICPEQGISLTEMNWQLSCYLGNLQLSTDGL